MYILLIIRIIENEKFQETKISHLYAFDNQPIVQKDDVTKKFNYIYEKTTDMKRILFTLAICLIAAISYGQGNKGSKFIDFTVNYDGKAQKLSDYVGNGKFMLVDFWASWCQPCRAEIPGLIKIYNKYKGENFGVLGVALNDKPENSKKLIENMGIPYPQILNAGNQVVYLYNIKGIPEIMLFGPDGNLIARGLRGPNIEKAVKEALEQHKKSK